MQSEIDVGTVFLVEMVLDIAKEREDQIEAVIKQDLNIFRKIIKSLSFTLA